MVLLTIIIELVRDRVTRPARAPTDDAHAVTLRLSRGYPIRHVGFVHAFAERGPALPSCATVRPACSGSTPRPRARRELRAEFLDLLNVRAAIIAPHLEGSLNDSHRPRCTLTQLAGQVLANHEDRLRREITRLLDAILALHALTQLASRRTIRIRRVEAVRDRDACLFRVVAQGDLGCLTMSHERRGSVTRYPAAATMIVMRAPWTTSGMSRPARLAPHTMMVTSAAATAAAVTFGEILDILSSSR